MEPIRIFIIKATPETRETIGKLLAFEPDFQVIGTAANGDTGLLLAAEHRPDIILIDPDTLPDMDGLEAIKRLGQTLPAAGIIAMSVRNDADYLRQLMLAGARQFLQKPVSPDELYNMIRTVAGRDVPPPPRPLPPEGDRAGYIIAVFSPTGGAGCTTVAISLAAGLIREDIEVLLIDASLLFGDVATFLNLRLSSTLVDAVKAVREGTFDIEELNFLVTTHHSGLKVLAAPSRPETGMLLLDESPHGLSEILNRVATYYDFVVVDAGHEVNQATVGVLESAHKIVLLVNPTLASVKNARLMLDWFDAAGFEVEAVALVVNKAVAESARARMLIPAQTIQQFLKRPLAGVIPAVDEPVIQNAVGKGIPVIDADRDRTKPPIRQLKELADYFYHALMGGTQESIMEPRPQSRPRAFFKGGPGGGVYALSSAPRPAAPAAPVPRTGSLFSSAPRAASPPAPDLNTATARFSAYYPQQIKPEQRYGLYVYAHTDSALSDIQQDIEKFVDELGGSIAAPRVATKSAELPFGTAISVVPECEELEFDPPVLTKRWRGHWTRFDFDTVVPADWTEELAVVRVSIQVEGIEIAHIKCVLERGAAAEAPAPATVTTGDVVDVPDNPLAAARLRNTTARLYSKIFISYSRQDAEVARAYRLAQMAVGHEVFMDTENIRTGEDWRAALAKAIDEADIFQLFWSEHAAASPHVRDEWDYCLRFKCSETQCEGFIRPVYWEKPMPAPPPELSHLNFRYVPFK